VLLLGYEMYRLLTTKRVLAKPRRAASRKTSQVNPPTTSTSTTATTSTATSNTTSDPVCIDLDEEDSNKELLKGVIDVVVMVNWLLLLLTKKGCHSNIFYIQRILTWIYYYFGSIS